MEKRIKQRLEIFKEVKKSFSMGRDELKEYQLKKLKSTLLHVFDNCNYYKNKMEKAGINRQVLEDIKSLEDIRKIPFTSREDISAQYPFGLLSVPQSGLSRYGESTGTTSCPVNSCYTYEDWFENNCIVAYYLSSIISPEDTAALIVPYGYALVGQDVDRALELAGANVIAIGTISDACPVERVIRTLINTKTTVLVCSPSRAIYLGEEIIKEGYVPSKDLYIRKILCVGEGTSKEKAKKLKELFGAECYPMFGMTETNTLAMPCINKRLHLVESKVFFEVIDPVTWQSLDEGLRGELVVTSFVKGMPLIRYRTGDPVTIHNKKCGCGSSFAYLEHHGRIQDNIIIGNKKYQILDLEDVILKTNGVRFYTLKARDERLQVGIIIDKEMSGTACAEIKNGLEKRFGITADVIREKDDKIIQVIKNKVKPSISSVLEA